MSSDDFRLLIESGNEAGLREALRLEPALANRTIRWFLNQQNESDPLHYVSDCVGHGWLVNGNEGKVAMALLEYGAAIDGSVNRESPLIGAASLGAEKVAEVLVKAGASLESTSVFGARALHWAAWIGTPATVRLLVAQGAVIEARCSEFGATPLFWAVHGYGPDGPTPKRDQVGAAKILIESRAHVLTVNKAGVSALDLSKRCEKSDMHEMLIHSLAEG